MEENNIQWQTWEEQPQENNDQQQGWGEQPQQESIPSWGEEQPQQNQPSINWDEPQQQLSEEISQPPQLDDIPSEFHHSKNWSVIGAIDRISVNSEIYQFNSDLNKVLRDLNELELKPLDNEGRYDFNPKKDTDLGNVVKNLVEISSTKGLKVENCFVYKNNPLESSINIFRGKPKYQFVLFLQGDYDSGEVVLDLSSIGGPSSKVIDTAPNILAVIPGWVPFRISKNMSNKEFIALIGTFN